MAVSPARDASPAISPAFIVRTKTTALEPRPSERCYSCSKISPINNRGSLQSVRSSPVATTARSQKRLRKVILWFRIAMASNPRDRTTSRIITSQPYACFTTYLRLRLASLMVEGHVMSQPSRPNTCWKNLSCGRSKKLEVAMRAASRRSAMRKTGSFR